MKQIIEAVRLAGEEISPRHEIEVLCKACGYDLDEAEITADTCSDCGADLELQQNLAIHATSVPVASGGVM